MTTETKLTHTPGPWSCSQRGLSVFATRDSQQERIAKAELLRAINGDDASAESACEEEQANARLIATAPDMLEALEAAVAWGKHPLRMESVKIQPWFGRAEAAIAKAKGGAA